ncbi:MAG TPA: hypothetical protein VEV18_05195, partial [Steroidobacteraceae bacterium]|nr:hypothetical protein [Steroidobacteraceae bacterium]
MAVLHPSMFLLNVVAWVGASSVKGTVLIGVVTLLRSWLAPATASTWRHALWIPVLACLVCPIGLHVGLARHLNSAATLGSTAAEVVPHVVRSEPVAT